MILSEAKNFLFLHIPKNAGTSMTSALKPYEDRTLPLNQHATLDDIAEKVGVGTINQLFRFCIVRHPFDAAVSQYHYLRQTEHHEMHEHAMTFDTFEDFVLNWYVHFKDRQHQWTHSIQGQPIVNAWIKLEELDQSIPALEEKLGITIDMPRLNTSNHDKYEKYHTGKTKQAIFFHRAIEFSLYGYQP